MYVVESLYDTIWFCLLPIVHKASQREKEREWGFLTLLKTLVDYKKSHNLEVELDVFFGNSEDFRPGRQHLK